MKTKLSIYIGLKTILVFSCALMLTSCYKSEEIKDEKPIILQGNAEPIVHGGWRKMGSFFNEKTELLFVFTIENKSYFIVSAYPEIESNFYEYNSETNGFTAKKKLPEFDMHYSWGLTIGDKGYCGLLNKIWEYDPLHDTWTGKANFPNGDIRDPGRFSKGDLGYICGYQNNEGFRSNDTLYIFNPKNNTWSTGRDFAGSSQKTTEMAFSLKGNPIFIAGNFGMPDDIRTWEYNSDSNDWYRVGDFPYYPHPSCYWTSNDKPYFYAGTLNGKGEWDIDKSIWTFDRQSNLWTKFGEFPATVGKYPQGFAHGEKMYLGFGDNSGLGARNMINELWEFNP